MRIRNIIFALVIAAGCGGKKDSDTGGSGSAAGSAGSGSSMAAGSGSGSSMAGSGSAMAGSGSGSSMAGSGSGAGSGSSAMAGSGSDAGSGSAAKEPEQDAFLKLSKDDKLKIMKQKVMPAMSKAFKGHDAKKFAKFNCKTCHGKGVDDKTFKMPNPDLPALDFEALKAGKQNPAMAKFMGEVVEPDMAKILEVPKFEIAHPEKGGFGCLACHVQKK